MGEITTPLHVGDVSPNIIRQEVLSGTEFNLHAMAKTQHGILINFFRGEF